MPCKVSNSQQGEVVVCCQYVHLAAASFTGPCEVAQKEFMLGMCCQQGQPTKCCQRASESFEVTMDVSIKEVDTKKPIQKEVAPKKVDTAQPIHQESGH